MESIIQLLISLTEQIKLAQQKLDELSQIFGKLSDIRSPSLPTDLSSLTEREREIFDLLSQGIPPKKIAEQLKINVKTVYLHRDSIKGKLHFPSFEQQLKNLSKAKDGSEKHS